MRKDIECPYCGHEQDICHDDGFGYEEGVPHEDECEECEKRFTFFTHISFSYEPYKADCLNGGDHDWHRLYTTMDGDWQHCHGCGKQINLTTQILRNDLQCNQT